MGGNPEGHSPRWWRRHQEATSSPVTVQKNIVEVENQGGLMVPYSYPAMLFKRSRPAMLAWSSRFWKKLPEKKSDIISLAGLLLGLGSWGYSVLTPEPQIWLGMLLLSGAFLCLAALLIHILDFRWKGGVVIVILVGCAFWLYTRKIVITPVYKKQLLAALQEGYGLRDECGSRKYDDETPRFMEDSEERWMSRTQTILEQTGKADDLQMWHESELVGLAVHSNLIGFRCTRMAIKTSALETIISRHYDHTIKGQEYNGPVYVLDLQKGASIKLKDGSTIELHATPN